MSESGDSRNGRKLQNVLLTVLIALVGYLGNRVLTTMDERDSKAERHIEVSDQKLANQDRRIDQILQQHSQMILNQQDQAARLQRIELLLAKMRPQ